jgi:ribosomal protein S4
MDNVNQIDPRRYIMISAKRLYVSSFALLLLVLGAAQYASAQAVRVPRPSQKASVMQTIGVTDVTITYSRPGVKGRKIWGDALPTQTAVGEATLDDQTARPKDAVIVPWGHAWRTGANEATQFVVTDDVLINGQKLAAGSYSLHTIPNKDEWTVIFNSEANQWGSFNYNSAKDTLRVKVKPEGASENKEWLEYGIEPVNESTAKISIRWEKIVVPFTVEVKDVPALALAKARSAVASAKPDDWNTPYQAANFALSNPDKTVMAEGAGWLDQSIKIKETYQNLARKARLVAGQGNTAEAITLGEKALVLGKAAKANTSGLEKSLGEWKAKK